MAQETLLSDAALAIRKRMSEVEITQVELAKKVKKSQAWVNAYLFGDTEKTLRRILIKGDATFDLLAEALDWSTSDLIEKTKLDLPGFVTAKEWKKTAVVRSSRHIPTYRLTVSQGRREFVPTDIRTFIDDDWPGEFEAAILSEDNGVRRTIIYQLTGQAQNGQTIILEVKESGKTVATVIDIQEDTQTYFLEAETPFVVKNPEILGVVWRETKDYIRS